MLQFRTRFPLSERASSLNFIAHANHYEKSLKNNQKCFPNEKNIAW